MRPPFVLLYFIASSFCPLTAQDPNTGTYTDLRDGHDYKWVKIGTQVWMAENLAYLPVVYPSTIYSAFQPYYYVYDYEGSDLKEARNGNHRKYGVLYNWEAAINACPSGWHLPTDAEWKTLEKYLGMDASEADKGDIRENGNAGLKLKSRSGWILKTANGDNSSGFNALPGGYKYQIGGFYSVGYEAHFWTATKDQTVSSWSRTLYYASDGVRRLTPLRINGYSVRCIQN